MEGMSDKQLKRELSFDLYGRYAIVRDIVNINRDGQTRYKILDVGGRGNLLKKFLPLDDVSYLDPYVDTDDENYIEGDGCDIPLEDDTFDFVVSSDVFEHIEPSKRRVFLAENLRVAKYGVVLGAVFHSRERKLAETYANDSYRHISRGEDHFWLSEHIKNGLPRADEVEELLREKDLGFQKIMNNDLRLWEYLLCSSFVFLAAGKVEMLKDFNEFYNEVIFPVDHGDDSYRTIYFIKNIEGLKDLEPGKGGVDLSLHLEAIKNITQLLSQVYLEDKEKYELVVSDLLEKEALVSRQKEELEEKKRELHAAHGELNSLRSTLSWRITGPLRSVREKMGKK